MILEDNYIHLGRCPVCLRLSDVESLCDCLKPCPVCATPFDASADRLCPDCNAQYTLCVGCDAIIEAWETECQSCMS